MTPPPPSTHTHTHVPPSPPPGVTWFILSVQPATNRAKDLSTIHNITHLSCHDNLCVCLCESVMLNGCRCKLMQQDFGWCFQLQPGTQKSVAVITSGELSASLTFICAHQLSNDIWRAAGRSCSSQRITILFSLTLAFNLVAALEFPPVSCCCTDLESFTSQSNILPELHATAFDWDFSPWQEIVNRSYNIKPSASLWNKLLSCSWTPPSHWVLCSFSEGNKSLAVQ